MQACNIPELTYPELKEQLRIVLAARHTGLILGHPGLGKSTLAKELADEMDLPLIDIRLAHKDPTEVGGIYVPDHANQQIRLYHPEWVRAAAERPHLVFLDEINGAVTKLHQSIAYAITLDRRCGELHFHPDTRILAAGNLPEDGAIVTPLADALLDRMWKAILKPHAETWLDWAYKQTPALSPDILAYIAWRKEEVLFQRGHLAMATPRSWTRAASLDTVKLAHDLRRQLVAGYIGQGPATEWWQFVQIYRAVNLDALLKDGTMPTLPKESEREASFLYALTFAVADRLASGPLPKDRNRMYTHLATLLKQSYFTAEFQAIFLKRLMGRDSKSAQALIHHPAMATVTQSLTQLLLG